MKKLHIKALCAACFIFLCVPLFAQKKELTFEQIFKGKAHNITSSTPAITG